MLAYLDALCAALLARNAEELDRLLALPLARTLPRQVREEALAIRRGRLRSFVAPVRTLHFYHQMLHVHHALGTVRSGDDDSRDQEQMELPLRASGGAR